MLYELANQDFTFVPALLMALFPCLKRSSERLVESSLGLTISRATLQSTFLLILTRIRRLLLRTALEPNLRPFRCRKSREEIPNESKRLVLFFPLQKTYFSHA